MAKSKSGGTRTYIRGRVGSDVYSIGRDAKGKKQQVVRSLAESVANPQTQAQMRGRMIMSTIAQAVAVLRPIVDHSFDGLVGARANLAEFTSRNYNLIKADVAAHPSSGNSFGLVAYGAKGAKQGAYVISDGKASLPSALILNQASGIITIQLTAGAVTIQGLKDVLGLSSDEYFTMVGLDANGGAAYERFRVNSTMANATAITAENVAAAFAVEGNVTATIALSGNNITISLPSIANCCAVIISKKVNGGYIHNNAVLGAGADFDYAASVALPTYPVGAADYLNGGDIFGLSERSVQGNAGSGSSEPQSPATSALTITTNGSGTAVVKNASNVTLESGAQVTGGTVITVTATPESEKIVTGTINGTSLSFSENEGTYTATFNMPNQAASLVINTNATSSGGDGGAGLDKD